jgi:glutathione S-transferase
MLKLYYAPGACSLASHITLEDARAPYSIQRVNTKGGEQHSAEYRKINPKGRVPALMTDKGVLTENPIIMGYVARAFPQAKLAPADDFAFAEMQSFNVFLTSSVHVAFAHIFRPGRYADGDDAATAMKTKSKASIDEYFKMIDGKLSDGRPFVHGEQYTFSDPYLLVFSRWMDRGDIGGVDKYEHVAAHRKRMEERPAVRKVLAAES